MGQGPRAPGRRRPGGGGGLVGDALGQAPALPLAGEHQAWRADRQPGYSPSTMAGTTLASGGGRRPGGAGRSGKKEPPTGRGAWPGLDAQIDKKVNAIIMRTANYLASS